MEGLGKARGTATTLAGFALVVVVSAITLAWLQSATPGLYGYDGWFHIRYAEILRSEGVSRSFPWWDETFLRDRYADKDFLYHVLLVPFTFGSLVAGGKAAAVVLGAASMGVFHLVMRRLRVPWPAAWTLVLLGCSTAFLYRLGFTRPALTAVAVAAAGTAAIFLRSPRWAFAFAALYPHVHISYHLLPCVALVHGFHLWRTDGDRKAAVRLAASAAAGAATGAVISPYFPNNLYLWWVQNVRVLGLAWSAPEDLGMGLEIRSGLSSQLLGYNAAVFLVLAAAVYFLARARRGASSEALTLLVISAGFLGLSMMSRRFVEFWVPFTILLAGVVARDEISSRPAGVRSPSKVLIAAAVSLLVAALLIPNARAAREIIGKDPGPIFEGASDWMRSNVPAGEKVFHLDWDQFPQLFFFNPQLRYLVGLDPAFMYVTDAARWRKWQRVTHGEIDDLHGAIRRDFDSRWVFAVHAAEDFMKKARRDPRIFPRYEDENAAVLFLADGFEFLESWEPAGWYANASRRLFEATLGPEPSSPGRPAGPPAQGGGAPTAGAPAQVDDAAGPPARGGSSLTGEPRQGGDDAASPASGGTGAFVDLRRLLGVPATVSDACGVARTFVDVTAPGAVTLALTTDDEHRLYVNGTEVASHSPLLDPPPGSPGGPAISLDDLPGALKRVEERAVSVTLLVGSNEVIVKVCQVGDDMGFYLRAHREDGSHLRSSR